MAAIVKNETGQGLPIFVQNVSAQTGVTGYNENLTIYVSKDGAIAVEADATASGTGNITEIGDGFYWVPLTQSETNADILVMYADTGTATYAADRLIVGTEDKATNLSEINAEVDSALADIGLHKLTSEAIGTATIADNSVVSKLADSSGTASWSGFDNTTDSLRSIRDNLSTGTATVDPADIWNHPTRTLTDYGTASIDPADVWTYGTRTLTDYGTASIDPADVWTYGTRTLTDSLDAADVWTYGTRTLTDYGTASIDPADVWTYGTRTLTEYGTASIDAADVWTYGTRTLTEYGTASIDAADVWSYGTRVLTEYGTASIDATDVWSFTPRTLTQTAEQISEVLSGSTLTVHRGDTLSAALTGLGVLTSYSKIWMTVKPKNTTLADSASTLQILKAASGTASDGLLYVDGASPESAANGSITVDDAAAGDITVWVDPVETAKLSPASTYQYDIQVLYADGTVSTLSSGTMKVQKDITRSVS